MKYLYIRMSMLLVLMGFLVVNGCDSPVEEEEVPGKISFEMDMSEAKALTNTEVAEVKVYLNKVGTDEERSETYTPVDDKVEATIDDLSPGTWDLRVEIFDDAEELLGDGETTIEIEPGETTQAQIEISLGLVDPESGKLQIHILWGYEERAMVSDEEDCITFNPEEVMVDQTDGGTWRIVDDYQIISSFGSEEDSEELANEGLRIIQEFAFTHYCFVGRPGPPMTYFLSHGIAPRGNAGGEDCISFNLEKLQVDQTDGGTWRIVDDYQIISSFGSEEDSEDLAHEGANLIRKYKFSKFCFVGRPDPPMTYFKEY